MPPRKGRGRIDSLLKSLGLTCRIQNGAFHMDDSIDYKYVLSELNVLRASSMSFLKSNLKIK